MTYDYNTRRNKLVLPEYGRNIQKMVAHLLTIEDKEERNKAAKTVIAVMGNLHTHLRDVADFKHKLWDHLAVISDFKLDIDSPYETPTKEMLNEKPKKIPYTQKRIRFKHYGHSIVLMIQKAAEMADGEEKQDLVKMIAYHMKKSYLTWNREAVDDREILEDLVTLSGNRLKPGTDLELPDTRQILAKNVRKKKGGGKKRQ
ncbi:MAG: DUF4290 domain-containing protein [Bacteroidales bacterium]